MLIIKSIRKRSKKNIDLKRFRGAAKKVIFLVVRPLRPFRASTKVIFS